MLSTDKNLLLVEDDAELASLLAMHLGEMGYAVRHARDGEEGLRLGLEADCALVILEHMLPKLDGLEVCRRLREARKSLLILMLGCRPGEVDRVVGLELGADDYVAKPFGMAELLARVRALLRRRRAIVEELRARQHSGERAFGELRLHLDSRRVLLRGRQVELSAREFDFLAFLSATPGRAYTRAQILRQLWDCDFRGYEYTVNSLIKRLRKKLEDDRARPRYIRTVRGVGYRFAEPGELGPTVGAEETRASELVVTAEPLGRSPHPESPGAGEPQSWGSNCGFQTTSHRWPSGSWK